MRIPRMNIGRVRHEAGGQCDNARACFAMKRREIGLDVLPRICVVTMPADGHGDIADAGSEASAQAPESESETLRQKSTDRALAGAAGTNQLDLPYAAHLTP